MITNELVTERLAALGSTPDEVTHNLTQEGVTGRRYINCPIQVYLESIFDVQCCVGLCDVIVDGNPDTIVRLPTAVRDFIAKFDKGEYPQMIRV